MKLVAPEISSHSETHRSRIWNRIFHDLRHSHLRTMALATGEEIAAQTGEIWITLIDMNPEHWSSLRAGQKARGNR